VYDVIIAGVVVIWSLIRPDCVAAALIVFAVVGYILGPPDAQHRGNTPLHFCFQFGYGDSLGQYLISKGANVNLKNAEGYTCFNDPASLAHGYSV
jgi:ankyrin repeat protein